MDLSKRASMPREVRRWALSGAPEIRSGDGGALTFEGEASVVEHPYTVRDMFGEFTETVKDGAFKKTLSENPDVVFLVNHEGLPLARTTSGTLRLSTNPNLSVRAELDPADPDVARVETKLRRGDLNEMSFAFRVTKQMWNEDYTERDIYEVSLHRGDVSIVNFGANPATSGALRGLNVDDDEFAEALAAARSGDATPDQLAVLKRAATALDEAVAEHEDPEPEPQVPLSVLEDLASLFENDLEPPAAA